MLLKGGRGMVNLSTAFRTIKLQKMIIKSLEDSNNPVRKEEQKNVYKLMKDNPFLLLTSKRLDTKNNPLYKYINVTKSKAKNQKLYKSTVRMLESQ